MDPYADQTNQVANSVWVAYREINEWEHSVLDPHDFFHTSVWIL